MSSIFIVVPFFGSKKKPIETDPDFTEGTESSSTENESIASSDEATTDVEEDPPEAMKSTKKTARQNAKNNKYDSNVTFKFSQQRFCFQLVFFDA